MNKLTKEQKYKIVKELLNKSNFSAYVISQNTSLTENGVKKIMNGESKNPQEKSLNELLVFFEKELKENKTNINLYTVLEPTEVYKKTEIQEFNDCLKKVNNLMLEIMRLQGILRKNNIDFDDSFEM